MKIRKNDNIMVISGRDSGKTGLVERVFVAEDRVVVKGVNIAKKHVKPSRSNPQGGIIDINAKINVSNIALVCPNCGKITRVGYQITDAKKIRICKKCGQSVEGGATK
ncbi:MAG: 50S ribosomal protein L24 [Patescibacteria group bacterium]|jgi:large subunit ribosomal protein L24